MNGASRVGGLARLPLLLRAEVWLLELELELSLLLLLLKLEMWLLRRLVLVDSDSRHKRQQCLAVYLLDRRISLKC